MDSSVKIPIYLMSELRDQLYDTKWTYMSPLQAEASFEERYDFLKVTVTLIALNQSGKLLCMNDDVEAANLSLLHLDPERTSHRI